MLSPEDPLGSVPLMVDIISSTGHFVYANETQERLLQFEVATLVGKKAEYVYGAGYRELLALLESGHPCPSAPVRLQLRRVDGNVVDVLAQLEVLEWPGAGRCVRAFKFACEPIYERLERLERDNEVLSSIISTARDASYCVEFLEPVDLTAPEHEIIRQVFENQCVWRYCNESMALMYKLPLGDDLNRHDVRDVFPRNPDNEAFVVQLNECGWKLDAALSRDHRYDGRDVFIENDVRADIRFGQLHRFWGTVRDPQARRLRETELEHQVSLALDILGALPDPVLVVNEQGRIEGANPAVEWKLGWQLESVLGAAADGVLSLDIPGDQWVAAMRPAALATSRQAHARSRDGRQLACEVALTEVGGDSGRPRCAAVLRFPTEPFQAQDETDYAATVAGE